ncbi:MAG TPA: amidohydrolase [Candidatus Binatus sp.]|jgi:5-methylthioadenosine/S-adenosylhomocysteine deaminase|nr:amidohydrolase [Candidatus Binatus sp.]
MQKKNAISFIVHSFIFCCIAFLLPTTLAAQDKHDKVDLLVTNGTVVTMDGQRRVIEHGAVAIRGDEIVALGPRAEIESKFEAAQAIDAQGALLLPGLVNGHAHAAMSLFRGLADDLSLDEWLQKYIFPAEARNVTPEFVEWGTKLGVLEMLRGGITIYADMYYFEDVVARVTKEAGMRGVLGETIIDFPAPDNKTPEQAFAYTQKYLDHWKGDSLIVAAVAPHSIYTCSEKTLQDSAALARRNNSPILIHIAEAPFELEQSRAKHGATPVGYLERIGFLGPDVVGAHCIWVDQADIAALAHFNVGCTNNPSSNMKTAAGVMPVPEMLAAGEAIGVATDGAASNNNQDLFEEMDLAAKLQKVSRMDPRALPAKQVVEMATINGARALHMEKMIGSLEPGKKADFILVDTEAPHATPMYDVYSEIVYALKASDVRTVVIAGKIVMKDRQMLTLDEKEILAKAQEYKAKIAASLAAPTPK